MTREDLHKLIDKELNLISLSEDELNVLKSDLETLCKKVADAKREKKINVLKEREQPQGKR